MSSGKDRGMHDGGKSATGRTRYDEHPTQDASATPSREADSSVPVPDKKVQTDENVDQGEWGTRHKKG
jgi:hypothetical protein